MSQKVHKISQTISQISPQPLQVNAPHTTFANDICVGLLQQLNQQSSSEPDLIFKHQILNGILKLFMEPGVELYHNADKFNFANIDP